MHEPDEFGQTLPPGTEIGGCTIHSCLGVGGMGEVYLAEDDNLHRKVALKILRQDVGGRHKTERFVQEAQLASQIDHPNVVTVFSTGEERGIRYITMQFIDGSNLAELIEQRRSPLPWQLALNLVRMAGDGLQAVHDAGLIHRDVKPTNIMLQKTSERVILMDFGLVREEDRSQLTITGDVLGTPAYMSPSQCRGDFVDRRTDVYSLGATLYCLVTGLPPFAETTTSAIKLIHLVSRDRQPLPASKQNPDVPLEVCALIRKAMAPNADDRYADIASMVREIELLLPESDSTGPHSWRSVNINNFLQIPHRISGEVRGRNLDHLVPIDERKPVADVSPEARPVERPRPVPAKRVDRSRPEERPIPDDYTPPPFRLLIVVGAAVGVMVLAVLVALQVAVWPKPWVREPPPPPPELQNMVLIEAGHTQLGNLETKIRVHLEQYIDDAQSIQSLVVVVAQEPQQRVEVGAFYIDKYEVTSAEYAEFLQAADHPPPEDWSSPTAPIGREDHPVRNVTYADAEAYAAWAGKKLPTREQWMRACRADTDSLFPWGDTYDATRALVYDNEDVPGSTLPVESTPRDVSPFGVFNLVGNVSEFVRGTFRFNGQPYRMVKGADFGNNGYDRGLASVQRKYAMDFHSKMTGFRCVIEVAPTDD